MRFAALMAVSLFASACLCSEASAETWFGLNGGSDGNKVRDSKPTRDLSAAWTTGNSMFVPTGRCVSYSDGIVFTSIGEFDSYQVKTAAFDAEDGQVLWQKQPAWWESCPTPHGDSVLTIEDRISDSRSVLSRLDSEDGSLVWETVLPEHHEFTSNQGVTVADGKVFTFTRDYRTIDEKYELRVFDLDNGAELWRSPGSSENGMPPMVDSGVVVVKGWESGISRDMLAYEIEDGSALDWGSNPTIELTRSAIDDGVIYYQRDQRYVQARDMRTGEILWTRAIGANGRVQDLVVDDSGVYVNFQPGGVAAPRLAALDLSNGSDLWPAVTLTGMGSTLAMFGGELYVASDTVGGRAIFDPTTGQRIGTGSGFPFNAYLPDGAYGDGSFYLWREFQHQSGITAGELVALRDGQPPVMNLTAPAGGNYYSTNQTLTWNATDGTGDGIDRFEIRLNGQLVATQPSGSRSYQLTGLVPGSNEITLTGFDLAGNHTSISRSIVIYPWPNPVAAIGLIPEVVLSGTPVRLDGSPSTDNSVLDGGIARYEWDTDGDGTFETDAGPESAITVSLNRIDDFEISLRVTNKAGFTSTAKRWIGVRRPRLPGAGLPGITINESAIYTNDPQVELRVSWPDYSRWITVSNDGGFATGRTTTFAVPEDGIIKWKLNSSGPERLPKQVYLRFYGTTTDGVVYTDDIILDERPPMIDQATLVEPGAAASTSVVHKRKKPKVRLRARDSNSGVTAIQAASSPKKRGPIVRVAGGSRKLRKLADPRVSFRPKLIRVRDAAGNWSKWKKIR